MLKPSGRIQYWKPGTRGYVTAFGHAHDWYPSEKWHMVNCEWIEPLHAIGPAPDLRPGDTTLTTMVPVSGWNNKFREVTLAGNPAVTGLQYYDGSVHAASETFQERGGAVASAQDLAPSWVLHFIRHAPPPGQGITTYITVTMQATHRTLGDAAVSIVLPLANKNYPHPFLHWIAPVPESGTWDTTTEGTIARTLDISSSSQQGSHREGIICQVEELWLDEETWHLYAEEIEGATYIGAYVLIRNVNNQKSCVAWWTEDLQFKTGPIYVIVAGAVQAFTLTPIIYGGSQTDPDTCSCEPLEEFALPTAANGTWATEDTKWVILPSRHDSWSITGGQSEKGRKPAITMQRTDWAGRYRRPLIWRAAVECPATIETLTPEGTWPQDTRNGHYLSSVSLTLNSDYKGATGTATIRPQWPRPLSDWAENGYVAVDMGLDGETGLWAEQTVMTGRILPDGISPSRNASDAGRPALTVSFGDLAAGVLRNKVLIDWRSYAGRPLICTEADPCSSWETGYCWLHALANRMGLRYEEVQFGDAETSRVIPVNRLPSQPTLLAPDGTGYLEHIRAVEAACGVRVRFDYDGDGKLSVDTGPPEYEHGVSEIAFVIDEDATDPKYLVSSISVDRGGERWRNAAKFVLRQDKHQEGDVQASTYYWVDAAEKRIASVVDDWWTFIADDDAASFALLWERFQREGHRWAAGIRWTMPLCPGLRPDDFVQLNVSGLGLPYGSVYQITQHTMTADMSTGMAQSSLTATIVYPVPEEGPY